MKKIWVNTIKVPCAICGDKVHEILDKGKSRVLKNWFYCCDSCWIKVDKQVKSQEIRIKALEDNLYEN